ncbi:MAG: hypothetical protein KJ601_05905 [Nanoarchaeota archaeon]|nr:hypothetical protein [Nanoarchaeota archaeon]
MQQKAWIVTVDMGYGHQRAAYPFKDIAYERIVTANSDNIVTKKERKQWLKFQRSYERISRFKSFPLLGPIVWKTYDRFQAISPFYPFRDLSRPSLGSIYMHRMIRKNFLRSVVEYTKKKRIPFVSSFFAPALAAAHAKEKDVYCIVTDTDITRIWVPEEPKKETLYYCTPTEHSTKRLAQYGVPEKNIFFTGFPLPTENTGANMQILKKDLSARLHILDPNKIYTSVYKETLKKHLGKSFSKRTTRKLTLTFAVGGAGAEGDIGATIIKSLQNQIRKEEININLIAGTRPEVKDYFENEIKKHNLGQCIGKNINIMLAIDKDSYFAQFNQLLRTTDILWTKPSELSFYTALGIPIIIAPPIGSHEVHNKKWLITMGSGIEQEDPEYCNEWIYEWINKGILAEAAWEGYNEAPKYGTYNIKKLIFSKDKQKVKFKY